MYEEVQSPKFIARNATAVAFRALVGDAEYYFLFYAVLFSLREGDGIAHSALGSHPICQHTKHTALPRKGLMAVVSLLVPILSDKMTSQLEAGNVAGTGNAAYALLPRKHDECGTGTGPTREECMSHPFIYRSRTL
jgi:hypothetical protein